MAELGRYRKRPVVIDAVRWDGSADVFDAIAKSARDVQVQWTGDGELRILTLEGQMTASVGDWVIRGVQGELYPCRPDIFAATYEPA